MKKLTSGLLTLCPALNLAACGTQGGQPADNGGNAAAAEPVSVSGTQAAVVEGFDWGPGVTKTILALDQAIQPESVSAEAFAVKEVKESFDWETMEPEHIMVENEREVTDAYTCDENGAQVSEASDHIALELYCAHGTGNPFCYDNNDWKNLWCSPYQLQVSLTEGAALAAESGAPVSGLTVAEEIDFSAAQMPDLDGITMDRSFTGSDGRSLLYASYEPAASDEKKPLVIWLHGAGEGGDDTPIALLGNEVTALMKEEFQTAMGGAYILVPQASSFWMAYDDEGHWDNPGIDSIYRVVLKDLIDSYVAENPGIDPNRIIIGGCSNGGYMTINMEIHYPDFFAAAYPICEAYGNANITDEEIRNIATTPTWFVYADNDTTVDPKEHSVPTIERLRAAGADVHCSVFEDVHDMNGYTDEDGSPHQYAGHWSWVYFFNNQCEDDGVKLWDWLAQQSR